MCSHPLGMHACMAGKLYRHDAHIMFGGGGDAPSYLQLLCPLTCEHLQLCMASKPQSTWNSWPHVMGLFKKHFQGGWLYEGNMGAKFALYHVNFRCDVIAVQQTSFKSLTSFTRRSCGFTHAFVTDQRKQVILNPWIEILYFTRIKLSF